MELGNYKIKVKTEAESKEVISLLIQVGYKADRIDRLGFVCTDNGLIYTDSMVHWDSYEGKILTLPQLRDLVVLHRNDVKDANYTYSGKPVLKLDTRDYKVWDSKNNTWTEHVGSQTDLRKGIKPTQPEQCLISGADALRALADGKEVEFFYRDVWDSIGEMIVIDNFMSDKFKFRLKPRTITLNIEIPAPFEPKNNEIIWILNTERECGYEQSIHHVGVKHDLVWKSEHDIQQVVAALRGALKNG